jgi:hypothetical protein
MGGGTTQQAETSLLDRAQATRKAKPCEPNPSRRRSAHPKTHHTLTSLNRFHERPHPQFVFAAVAKGFEGTGPAGSYTLRSGMVDERLSHFEEVSQRTREPSKQTVHQGFVFILRHRKPSTISFSVFSACFIENPVANTTSEIVGAPPQLGFLLFSPVRPLKESAPNSNASTTIENCRSQ